MDKKEEIKLKSGWDIKSIQAWSQLITTNSKLYSYNKLQRITNCIPIISSRPQINSGAGPLTFRSKKSLPLISTFLQHAPYLEASNWNKRRALIRRNTECSFTNNFTPFSDYSVEYNLIAKEYLRKGIFRKGKPWSGEGKPWCGERETKL